jgi:hypothetical protein
MSTASLGISRKNRLMAVPPPSAKWDALAIVGKQRMRSSIWALSLSRAAIGVLTRCRVGDDQVVFLA